MFVCCVVKVSSRAYRSLRVLHEPKSSRRFLLLNAVFVEAWLVARSAGFAKTGAAVVVRLDDTFVVRQLPASAPMTVGRREAAVNKLRVLHKLLSSRVRRV